MNNRVIRVGVSLCLLGEPVRYDGQHKYCSHLVEHLPNGIELAAFCPEVAIGMGVPRAPIQLVQVGNGIRVHEVGNAKHNVTEQLTAYAFEQCETQVADLGGFIFKKNSPSCGPDNVDVFDLQGCRLAQKATGIFAAVIRQQFPELPIIDEHDLANRKQRDEFFQQVRQYATG